MEKMVMKLLNQRIKSLAKRSDSVSKSGSGGEMLSTIISKQKKSPTHLLLVGRSFSSSSCNEPLTDDAPPADIALPNPPSLGKKGFEAGLTHVLQEQAGGEITIQKDGSTPQSGFVLDKASGYCYHAALAFYFDGNTCLYYDANQGVWYAYDQQTQQYIPLLSRITKTIKHLVPVLYVMEMFWG
ncbi:hypothetical protein SADUNF_Sadunf12G0093200 [Salix dunnii]|uniref:OCRE domain-containing protein n=1 Tax=Salix dunnii TaxID=1413687 RepID=A0A835JNP7_9ROSI|nr:hypothetical protein SADUNF_Sadunf12G0093200 [Salix dunnii]